MKVSFLPENLIKFLPLVNKVIPTNTQVPILSNVLLVADKKGLFLTATDLDLGVRIKIPAKIEEEGGVTIPGREFMEAVNNLPKEKIELLVEKESLIVVCADNNLDFNTIGKDEYPLIYKEKGEEITTLPFKEFVDIFSNIMFSISQEETRPQLTGIYVDPKEKGVNFVTTDGFRMSIKKKETSSLREKKGLIIPSKMVNEALSLKEDDVDVIIYQNDREKQIIIEIGEALLVGRMIEEKFPDYEGVLPKNHKTVATFNREELLQKTRLISVFAKNNSNIATLTLKDKSIQLETKSQGVGGGEAVMECDQEGEDVKIAFNIKYLSDVLKAGKGKEMNLKLNSGSEPALFEDENGDFLHVIMPIQVD